MESVGRLSRENARRKLRECLGEGLVIPGSHFRQAIADDNVKLGQAWMVLETGSVYREPEYNMRTREWKYLVEGYDPVGRWLAIAFAFTSDDRAFLITSFEDKARRRGQ